jgi:flagellar motor protein MotB
MRYNRNTEETNFWAGYADCMLALFMIALVMWILSAGITTFTDNKMAGIVSKNESLKEENESLKEENERLKEENEALRKELEDGSNWYAKYKEQEKELAKLVAALKQTQLEKSKLEQEKKQLITENEKVLVEIAGIGETFESGNAVINAAFRRKLEVINGPFGKIAANIKRRKGKVVLEIIGHTDGQPLSSKNGNLDTKLPYYLTDDNYSVEKLKSGSNNDLGLLRALAIRKAWISYIKNHPDKHVNSVKIHCYSAGQTVPPEGGNLKLPDTYSKKNDASRRIEMRLRNTDN